MVKQPAIKPRPPTSDPDYLQPSGYPLLRGSSPPKRLIYPKGPDTSRALKTREGFEIPKEPGGLLRRSWTLPSRFLDPLGSKTVVSQLEQGSLFQNYRSQ